MRVGIGGDHSIEFVEYEGDAFAGMNDYHVRPDGTECKGFIAIEGGKWAQAFDGMLATWKIESHEPLTLSPSLLCRVCGDHGFIRNGKWEKA